MHVKYDDKEPGSETPEQDESFADIQATEDTSELDQIENSEDSLEAEPTDEEESMIGLLSVIEPATIDEALSDDGWILAMQEELNQFQRNHVWNLVPKPQQNNIIGTKWVFRNKVK